MALERFQPKQGTAPNYPAGAVLFDTTLPEGILRCYHVMLVKDGRARSTADGRVELPICDMTLQGIHWPEAEAWHQVHPRCYTGVLAEVPHETLRETIEELRALRSDPRPDGKNEIYSLACHGVREPDANAPGQFRPGIRCSCASLVEHCYEQAGIDLVAEKEVPELDAQQLWKLLVEGHPYRERSARQVLLRWGLDVETRTRWPVLLPAYQMRAFEGDKLPYSPKPDDHPYKPANAAEPGPV